MNAIAPNTGVVQTPWGVADEVEQVAEGIICVATPGHGGFHLDDIRNAAIPAPLRNADGWYEEDCESAIVALTYPDDVWIFEEDAHRIVAEYWPKGYAKVYGKAALKKARIQAVNR